MRSRARQGFWVQRFFGLLLIRDEERASALYYLLLFLLLGAGLALGRGTMDALFLKRYGIQYLPVMYAVLSVFLAALSLIYAAYVDRLSSERFFVILLGLLAALIGGSWLLMTFTRYDSVYPLYFLVYELASELLLLHAALYLSQNFDTLQLQRLSAPIFAGAQAGMIIGGLVLGLAAPVVGVRNLLLVWAALAGTALLLITVRHRRVGVSPFFYPGRRGRGSLRQSVEQVSQGLHFFRQSELFRMSSFALFFMVIAFFILCYSVNRVYTHRFTTTEELGAFFGWLTAATGASALLIQLFVTSKLLRRFGVKRVNFIFPVAGIASYLALLYSYNLPAAIMGSFTKDVLMPAIRRPARNVFLNALPDYMHGRVRALSVAIVLPLALVVVSTLLLLTQRRPNPAYFLVGGLLAVLAFAYFKLRVNRAYTATLLTSLREKLFLPATQVQNLASADREALLDELRRGLASEQHDICVPYARLLIEVAPTQAPDLVGHRIRTAAPALRDRLLRLLLASNAPVTSTFYDALTNADDHLRALILMALFERRDEHAKHHVPGCLRSTNPRLIAAGILGVERYDLPALKPEADKAWAALLAAPEDGPVIAGSELLARVPQSPHTGRIQNLLMHSSDRIRMAALEALAHQPSSSMPELASQLEALHTSGEPALRKGVARAGLVLNAVDRRRLFLSMLDDPHIAVREVVLNSLEHTEGHENMTDLLRAIVLNEECSPRAQDTALTALSRYPAPRQAYEQIAAHKIDRIEQLAAALHVVREAPASPPLLVHVLTERLSQTVDLLLRAISHFEDPGTITTIRAGLHSNDRRLVAQACETLRHGVNREFGARLGAVLTDAGQTGSPISATSGRLADVIAWCRQHGDPWLRACATNGAVPAQAPGN